MKKEIIFSRYKEVYLTESFSLEEDFFAFLKNLQINKNNIQIINIFIFTSAEFDLNNIISFLRTNYILSRSQNWYQVCIQYLEFFSDYEVIQNDNVLYIKLSDRELIYIDWIRFTLKSFVEEVNEMYKLVFQTLNKYSFDKNTIVKSWNYIKNVLINYKDFNLIRDKYFRDNWICWNYPAWTWIDCLLNTDYNINSSIFAIKWKDKAIELKSLKINSQIEAENYWPKFSRAKLIDFKNDGIKKIYISWTAAVSPEWKTLYSDNINENINYTMNTVKLLLNEVWMNFDDIVSSFVYLKKPEFLDNYLEYHKNNKFNFPYIYTFCDICRDDWLFEFECVAFKKI